MKQENSHKRIGEENLDFESKSNLVGLFALLQKIDKRNNPELYKRKLTIDNKK